MAPISIQPVNSHHNFAGALAARFKRRANLLARLGFGIGRNRIFQIEQQTVGIQCTRLLKCAGIGPRHVKSRSARDRGFL